MNKLDNLNEKEFLTLIIILFIGIVPFLILPLMMFTFMEVLNCINGYDEHTPFGDMA